MAIKIDYSKCYNNNSEEIGKSNLINSVTVDLINITEESQSKTTTVARDLIKKEFTYTDYDPSSKYKGFLSLHPNNGKPQKLRSWFYTTITITLPYSTFPELKDATDITISEQNISKTGRKRIVKTETSGDLKSYSISSPLYSDSFFQNAETFEIVSSKTEEETNKITYSEVISELGDKYKFSGSFVGDSNSKYSYKKYDSYIAIEISILSKLQVYQASLGFINWSEDNIEYEYDNVSIVIEYTAPNISKETESITYGENIGNDKSFSSDMFVNGNTEYGSLDYSFSFANSVLDEFKNGKNILSLTIPVGNFEIEDNDTDILNVGDKCYLEEKLNKDWVTITDKFNFESKLGGAIPVPSIIDVNGLNSKYKTTFTGRIYWNSYETYYEDFVDRELPFTMESTIVKESNGEITEIKHYYKFSVADNGILVTSYTEPEGYEYTDMGGMHSTDCVIKQYKQITKPIYTDIYGNSLLYKVIYTNLRYENGMLLEDIKLENVYNENTNNMFEHNENILTGIKSDYIDKSTIINIPKSIDGYVITEIGENFINGNNNVEKISFPYTITKIGKDAFSYTEGIRTPIILPNNLKRIEQNAFMNSNITGDLFIPEGVEFIGGWAFQGCSKVDGTLTIPSTFKFPYGQGPMFNGMTNLKKIIIYSDEINVGELNDINDFEDTGDCDIYVLDEMVDIFKSKMPDGFNLERIKSINTLDNN